MSLECLTQLIGIRGACDVPTVTPKYYIQDLPGISVRGADKAVNDEQVSGTDLINREIQLAAEQMLEEVRIHFGQKFRSASLIEGNSLGFYDSGMDTVSSEAGKYKGIAIKLYNYDYLKLNLATASLMLQGVVSTTISIWDLVTGIKLKDVSITTVAGGVVQVNLGTDYTLRNKTLYLFIGYPSSVGGSYDTNINRSYGARSPYCTAYNGGCSYRGLEDHINFQAAEFASGSPIIAANLIAGEHTAGLSIDYSVNCTMEPLLCDIRPSWALLHLVGARILAQYEASRNWNSFIMLGKKDREEMVSDYMNVYNTQMERILRDLNIQDNLCFECRKTISNATVLP